ncbi:MAG: hypothetical protein JXB49_28710 [Bacteroidales bacterium]|nr:hypothetical protein [Bacteroidales bacterium]
MKNTNKIGVIILGGHIQSLGIIRVFGKQEIPSVVIDKTAINISRHSRYCKKFFKIDNEELLSFLLNSDELLKYKDWLIFPSSDFHVKLLSQEKQSLEKRFKIATDKWEVIELFYNKINSYNLLKDKNIQLPVSFFPRNFEDLNTCNLHYPVIIKPAVMHEFYSKVKKKVLLCKNFNELQENYKMASEIIDPGNIIVQEVIPGNFKAQFSACFFAIDGKPIVSMLGQRCRQHPLNFGNATTYAETISSDYSFYTDALEILRASNYTGLCEIEFMYDYRDNTYKFLEVNPRTWKWHSIANKSESPFLMNFYNYIYGKPYIEKNDWEKASFRHRTTDIPVCLKIISKGMKVKTKRSNLQFAVWDNKDILPSIFELLYLPVLIFTR